MLVGIAGLVALPLIWGVALAELEKLLSLAVVAVSIAVTL
jgi:hypothetical protein